jgi:cytidyltransferase-like protein
MANVLVTGSFDDLRSLDIRFLEEASKRGPLTVSLWDDAAVKAATGRDAKFPLAERRYFVESIRYVSKLTVAPTADVRAALAVHPDVLIERERDASAESRSACGARDAKYEVVSEAVLEQFPKPAVCPENPIGAKKVMVTGCFDWFHSGHVRFFEEVSELGDLYVIVGHDANIKLLKGDGHPLFPESERCYIANSIRFAKMALVSSGDGWLDAEPEVEKLRPDIYAVNEDGDRPEKREFCEKHSIEYRVLKRMPKPGLDKRQSTALRGF